MPGRNGGAGVRVPLEREQCRAHEEQAADEGRDRVAGEPEHERAVTHAEGERLAGSHRDAPEDLLDAEAGRHPPDEVVRADRDASRGDDHVRLERPPERTLERLLRVLGGRKALDPRAALGQHGLDHDPVRLVDLAGRERLARIVAAPSPWRGR